METDKKCGCSKDKVLYLNQVNAIQKMAADNEILLPSYLNVNLEGSTDEKDDSDVLLVPHF